MEIRKVQLFDTKITILNEPHNFVITLLWLITFNVQRV